MTLGISRTAMRIAYGLAAVVLVAQPVSCLRLFIALREHSSPFRETLFHALFFPSTVFDSLVRFLTHKPPVLVFGAFTADVVFGFLLNAVVWSILVGAFWLGIYALGSWTTKHLTSRWSERRPVLSPRAE
jgi:hypothetical protein